MADILTDIMAIIGVILNGLPQGLLALSFGFASIPTALAFFVGAFGNVLTQSVAPISFQAETITYAGTAGDNKTERISMIFIGAVIMAIIGAFGLLTKIVDFIGNDIASGMMAGVGLILTKLAVDMAKSDKLNGIVSIVTALLTYYFTKDNPNTLVYTIVFSVIASCIFNYFFNKEKSHITIDEDKIKLQKLSVTPKILMGALAMVCLNIGSNISFGSITASMAKDASFNVDHLTVISSLADMVSSIFGGAPVESIISATANAPHAVWAGIAMMALMGVILITGILPKLSKYVPSSSIAGFLLVLGVFKTFIINAPTALSTAPSVGGTALVATAIANPFVGMLLAVIVRLLGL